MIVALVVGIAALLAYALAWLPLERARARLQQELPALRASVDRLQRLVDGGLASAAWRIWEPVLEHEKVGPL